MSNLPRLTSWVCRVLLSPVACFNLLVCFIFQAGKKREKGQVNLSKVLVVEEVNNGALDNAPKGFPFQVSNLKI